MRMLPAVNNLRADRQTRESKGFAFVRFNDKKDAEDAIEAMDGQEVNGRKIVSPQDYQPAS